MMNRQENNKDVREQNAPGVLYLCATPIGNLEDMTYRAVRILGEVPLIAAEDTRHTRQLLTHFDIHTKLTSYHEHNKEEKGPELIRWMLDGNDLACVSDAGLPGVADPGSLLAQQAIEAGIRVIPLPGANAALSALICSGLDTTRFSFVGFLPKTKQKRKERLEEVKNHRETLLFYEAPHHLKATMTELYTVLGDRPAVLARELTKKFEEFARGTLSSLRPDVSGIEPRGEYVIVVEGMKEAAEEISAPAASPSELVEKYMAEGQSKKEAMRSAAQTLGISRRDVYQALLENGN